MGVTGTVLSGEERELQQMWRRLERTTGLVFAMMLLGAAWTGEPKIIAGVALGGILGWANYRWLSTSTRALLTSIGAPGKASGRAILLFAVRALVIWGAVGLAFWSRAVDILALVAGFCAFVAAVMVEVGRRIGLIILGREE
ncbi:hypothetical protein HRbin08_00131 [bacterium HR08]|nr:hypothetical protein HRbin08_00131 [bacterium HR08]